jgi:hypothetical protein
VILLRCLATPSESHHIDITQLLFRSGSKNAGESASPAGIIDNQSVESVQGRTPLLLRSFDPLSVVKDDRRKPRGARFRSRRSLSCFSVPTDSNPTFRRAEQRTPGARPSYRDMKAASGHSGP